MFRDKHFIPPGIAGGSYPRKGKKKPQTEIDPRCIKVSLRLWRSGWDSNPRAVARKLISSQPRYDHFDTTPY